MRGHARTTSFPEGRMTKIASNLQIDSARLWDTIHETAKFGATPKGGVRRLTLGPEDKQVRDWFRKACEAAGLEVHVDALGSMFGLRRGRDMSKLAGRPRLASRYPADRRQVRRRARHAGGARSGAHAQRRRDRDRNADLHRQLDQRGRLALRAGDDGLRRLCRRLHHRRHPVAQGCRRRHASARRSTASAIAARSRSARKNSAPSSNCISSRDRCWRPRTRPSAWSIAARASSGTTARSPVSKAMPAPRRCRCAAMRWRRCRKSCWRWSGSRRSTARTRSAPSAKP